MATFKTKKLWREPLFHFFVLGLLLFLLDSAFSTSTQYDRLISIDAAKRDLAVTFKASRGRPPSQSELESLTDTWLKNELLYREGLSLGLDRGDPLIRQRVIHKMRLLVMNNVVVAPPSEEELLKWFDDHRHKYDIPQRFDFTLFTVDAGGKGGQLEAEELLQAQNSGNEPEKLSRLAQGYRKKSHANIAREFGESFAKELTGQPLLEWKAIRSSSGWHVARLDAIFQSDPAEFETWSQKVRKDWQKYQHKRLAREALEEIRKSYVINLEDEG